MITTFEYLFFVLNTAILCVNGEYETNCSNLLMGQYKCFLPEIDVKTQQPYTCEKNNKAKSAAVHAKWKNLRDSYTKHAKIENGMKLGPASKKRRRYIYFSQLQFLNKVIDFSRKKVNDTNISLTNNENGGNESEGASFGWEATAATISTGCFKKEPPEPVLCKWPEVTIRDCPEPDKNKALKFEDRLMQFLESYRNKRENEVMDDDKAFFMSILPAVREFSVDQKLEFRIEVLNLIKKISNK